MVDGNAARQQVLDPVLQFIYISSLQEEPENKGTELIKGMALVNITKQTNRQTINYTLGTYLEVMNAPVGEDNAEGIHSLGKHSHLQFGVLKENRFGEVFLFSIASNKITIY